MLQDASRLSPISAFFWLCAGADLPTMRECFTDHSKYTAIGATVFLTAILALFSGGYVAYIATGSLPLVIPLAILWSALIFNLNRFLVLSLGKGASSLHSFFIALPRFLIACLIAIVVMTPLELRLFEPEITKQLRIDADLDKQAAKQRDLELIEQSNKTMEETVAHQRKEAYAITNNIREIKEELNKEESTLAEKTTGAHALTNDLRKSIVQIDGENDDLDRVLREIDATIVGLRYLIEVEAKGLEGRPAGQGQQYKLYNAQLSAALDRKALIKTRISMNAEALRELQDKRRAILDDTKSRIDALTLQLQEKERQLAIIENGILSGMTESGRAMENTSVAKSTPGAAEVEDGSVGNSSAATETGSFLNRIKALYNLAREERPAEWTIVLLQTLMILIESSPIIVKLLSPWGAYEAVLVAKEAAIVNRYQTVPLRTRATNILRGVHTA